MENKLCCWLSKFKYRSLSLARWGSLRLQSDKYKLLCCLVVLTAVCFDDEAEDTIRFYSILRSAGGGDLGWP
jgi:hypothetical protein